jgi:hypothetical protein
MKNASAYEKKIKKLLRGMTRVRPGDPPRGDAAVAALVESILQSDATNRQGRVAFEVICREYVDFNELRVSPVKDIVDCIGRDHPHARRKAETMTSVLNGVFQRTYDVNVDYMEKMQKRELRRHLEELGLGSYAAGHVILEIFGGHAIPVDDTLVEVLQMHQCVAPDSDIADVQGFLTRIIAHKDALSGHEFFRAYVQKSAKALAKKRKAEALARAKAEAEAKAKAEAKEKAKQEAEARRKAKAKAKAREAAKKKKKAIKPKRKTAAKAEKRPSAKKTKKTRKVASAKRKKAASPSRTTKKKAAKKRSTKRTRKKTRRKSR